MRPPINLPYTITSPYGYREYRYQGQLIKGFHDGIDFVNNNGDTKVFPVLKGKIIKFEWHSTTGFYAIIEHFINQGKLYSKYCHLENKLFEVGYFVNITDCIGKYGVVGHTTGAHVHVSVYDSDWDHFDFISWIDNSILGENL
jgi:murein DD-endopeptidase MepM/ murein hydrolase activator NlpD